MVLKKCYEQHAAESNGIVPTLQAPMALGVAIFNHLPVYAYSLTYDVALQH